MKKGGVCRFFFAFRSTSFYGNLMVLSRCRIGTFLLPAEVCVTAGPQARWLPAWPSPRMKAASLPFAPDLSFLCLSSATDDFSPVSPRLTFCSVFCWLCLAVYLHILLFPLLSLFLPLPPQAPPPTHGHCIPFSG